MKNECEKCGGGIRPGYTAPEARCICNVDMKTVDRKMLDDVKHELLLLETRYLRLNGWTVGDYVSQQDGYTWTAPNGDPGLAQELAVQTQKRIEADPMFREWWTTGIKTNHLSTVIIRKRTAGQDCQVEEQLLKVAVQEMTDITTRKTAKVK